MTVERVALSMDEAASALGISRSMVNKLIWRQELRSVKAGTRTLIPVSAVYQYLDRTGIKGK
jgi:excisionase family DNA binding protein